VTAVKSPLATRQMAVMTHMARAQLEPTATPV
jgi:hypothetical protein